MEAVNCTVVVHGESNNVDYVLQPEVSRSDVHFKLNLLSLQSKELDSEMNAKYDVDEDGSGYEECYDGPYHYFPDEYDDYDVVSPQQTTIYSNRHYSLLESIQEETYDELLMSCLSDEDTTSFRSDCSGGGWYWGDDYSDDESPSHQTQNELYDVRNDVNILSEREGSWLDFDDQLDQFNQQKNKLKSSLTTKFNKEMLFFNAKNMSRNFKKLHTVKSAPNLSAQTDDSVSSCVDDHYKLKAVSNLAFYAVDDVISWTDDITRSQSLPCLIVTDAPKRQQNNCRVSEFQVNPSLATHLDNIADDDVTLFISKNAYLEKSHNDEEEEEKEEYPDNQHQTQSNCFQPLLPVARLAKPTVLRSFRSFDSLHLVSDLEEMGNASLNGQKVNSKSSEELSEDSGCYDSSMTSNGYYGDEEAASSAKVGKLTRSATNVNNNEKMEQLPVNVELPTCLTDVCKLKTSFISQPRDTRADESSAIVSREVAEEENNGSGILPIENMDAPHNAIRISNLASLQHPPPLAIDSHVTAFSQVYNFDSSWEQKNNEEEERFGVGSIDLNSTLKSNPIMRNSELANNQSRDTVAFDDDDDCEDENLRTLKSCGWVLLRLNSQNDENAVDYHQQRDFFEPSTAVNNFQQSGARPTRVDVTQVGVGAAKNRISPEEKQKEKENHGSRSWEGEASDLSDKNSGSSAFVTFQPQTFPTQLVTDATTSTNYCVVTVPNQDDNDGVNFPLSQVELPVNKRDLSEIPEDKNSSSQIRKIDETNEKLMTNMGILVEKEKKSKSPKRSWWFFSHHKQNKSDLVTSTSPSTNNNAKSSKKEKSSGAANGVGESSNHGNRNLEAVKTKGEDNDDTKSDSVGLDIETFTNNLWIEFENELKGVWPSRENGGAAAAANIASSSACNNEALPAAKLPERMTVLQASRCRDDKVQKNDSVGKNGGMTNHVVKGKPPLPTPPSATQKGRVKTLKKMDEEEINEPGVVFDRLRQIVQDGRNRAAKTVQELNGKFKVNDENGEINEQITPPVVDKFLPRYAENVPKTPDKRWQDSSQSLVGYLETDIDTFHSREVIHLGQHNNDASNVSLTSQPETNFNFGPNVRRYRPVKLKTQSMFNLMDGNKLHEIQTLTPEVDDSTPDQSPTSGSRAKSVEFLLKAENKAAAATPENRLMRLKIANQNDASSPETETGLNRSMSEQEESIWRSLQKLNLPEWYTNSRATQNGSGLHSRKNSEDRHNLRWEDFRNRATSSSSIASGRTCNGMGMHKQTTPNWRYVRSSRESLVQSSSSATSSTMLDKSNDSHNYSTSGWGLANIRLSANSSRSSSPTVGMSTSGFYKSSYVKPYLGWRSSEKLAATGMNSSGRQNEKPSPHFYRSAAERLSKGPGYYALRFGVYTNGNNTAEQDISIL